MKTEPWKLADQIGGEFSMLEHLLEQKIKLDIEIAHERAAIRNRIKKALEAFQQETIEATK